MKLNPDWPEFTDVQWNGKDPHEEIASAFGDYPTFATAAAPSATADPFTMGDMAAVTQYYLRSDNGEWKPGDDIYTELNFVIKGRLNDGRWFSGTLWNDYTGWGCQSGADFRVAATEAEIDMYGLGDYERGLMGIALPPDSAPAVDHT